MARSAEAEQTLLTGQADDNGIGLWRLRKGEKLRHDLVGHSGKVSTRILGRRTAPFPALRIAHRVPRGFTPIS